jgi:hypothetical protein
MSNGSPPIQTAPVPPSIAGSPQPVFESGSATSPATPIDITGSPIIPPPPIGDPEGVPVFPPVTPDTAPVPVPVGPLVGPAIAPAAVPPSIPGVVQPQFVPPGSATVPASLFPDFTTTPPSPPIVFANIFNYGQVAPPNTPGQTPPPIVPSAVATIPQLPWNPSPNPEPPPVNTVRPVVQIVTDLQVGSTLALTTGTWTGTGGTITYARNWTRNGSPIAGATSPGYVLTSADVGAQIGGNVTATDSNGEASMDALTVGPIIEAPPAVPSNTTPPQAQVSGTILLCTGGNWTPASPMYTLNYQWFAGGTAVSGATTSSWPYAGHEGETAYCAVSATNTAGTSTVTNTNTVTIPAALDEPDTLPAALAAPVRHRTKAKSKRKR